MIGEMLKSWMKDYDISLRDISSTLDISPATISRITKGGNVDQRTMVILIKWMFEDK